VAVVAAVNFWPRAGASPQLNTARLASDPTLGPASAPITPVEYGDFGRTQCQAWYQAGVLQKLRAQYADKLQVIWRDCPHTIPESPQAAEAGQCAFDQGKFWEYHDLLYERVPALSQADLEAYATQVGLDAARFKVCLETHQDQAKVEHNLQDALGRHLPGTPAFLVNDRPIIGGKPFEYFKGLMDPALAGGA
jgi:protein-disulfide isomerase